MPEQWLSSICKKVTNKNLRCTPNAYAHLQTLIKTHVKFQKNRHNTEGVVYRKYLLLKGRGGGSTDVRKYFSASVRNAEYYAPTLNFEKAADNHFYILGPQYLVIIKNNAVYFL